MSNYHMDLKELTELIDITSAKLPELITNLLKTIYSPEAASNMGKAMGILYKELIESGISEDIAVKMCSDYMISLKGVMKNAFNHEDHNSKR